MNLEEIALRNNREHMRRERLRAMRLVGESRTAIEMAKEAVQHRINAPTGRMFGSVLRSFDSLLAAIHDLPDEKETR